MSSEAVETSKPRVEAEKTIRHLSGSITSGYFHLFRVASIHFILLALSFALIMSALLGGMRINSLPLLLGGALLIPIMFLIKSHLFFNYVRVFLLGPKYAHRWGSFPEEYGHEQRRKTTSLYWKFTGKYVLISILLFGVVWLDDAAEAWAIANRYHGSVYAVISLLITVLLVWSIGFFCTSLVATAIQAPKQVRRDINSHTAGDKMRVLPAALIFGFLVWLPTWGATVFMNTESFEIIAGIPYAGALILGAGASFLMIWELIIYSALCASIYGQLNPETRDYQLDVVP